MTSIQGTDERATVCAQEGDEMAGGISEETLEAMAACNVELEAVRQYAQNPGVTLESAAHHLCRTVLRYRTKMLQHTLETARAAGIDVPWPAPEAVPSGE